MKIELDGHLALHLLDLKESHRPQPHQPSETAVKNIREAVSQRGLGVFSYEAQITASYAIAAGHKVVFAMPGLLMDVPHYGIMLELE